MEKNILLLLFIFLPFVNPLQSEIEEVRLTWNAFKCLEPCARILEQGLRSLPQVSNIQIDARSGEAKMQWNSNYPFSIEPFRQVAARVGNRFEDIALRIRGTITRDSQNFYLVSLGDNTRFLLIGERKSHPHRFVPRNILSHPLSDEVKGLLTDAENRRIPVTITGTFFRPGQVLAIMIERVQIPPEQR